MASLPALFESKGFQIVESADVVQEVINALDEINEQKMRLYGLPQTPDEEAVISTVPVLIQFESN